jgi:uncharacterized protein (UPF0276 family)
MTDVAEYGSEEVFNSSAVAIGLAYSRAAQELVELAIDEIDYVEYPYELLVSDPVAASYAEETSAILHCASLSLASTHRCDKMTMESVGEWARRIGSPWVGEHFAFTREAATPTAPGSGHVSDPAGGMLYDIGFAISPPLTPETVRNMVTAIGIAKAHITPPILLENPPIYLLLPGTTMRQSESFQAVCAEADVGIVMDLAHLLISCDTLGLDPLTELASFPLSRIAEVHFSGMTRDSGVLWDDHSELPSPELYDLFEFLLGESPVRAVTHEYNWAPSVTIDAVRREFDRTRFLSARR